MSGLEVVGLVLGIAGAFGVTTAEYRAWRERKQQRTKHRPNTELQKLMDGNGPAVQRQYDADFRRLGQAFAQGDGKLTLSTGVQQARC